MKSLIVGDPLSGLKPATDTSLSIARESLGRRHKVYWATADQVRWEDGRVFVDASPLQDAPAEGVPRTGSAESLALRDFDLVWIRKDPPFDVSYLTLCWLLALEENKVTFLNRPSALLRYHEKLIPFEAVAAGFLKPADVVPTHIGSSGSARRYLERAGTEVAIRKPFLGFGGAEIQKFTVTPGAELPGGSITQLTQAFLSEITTEGDRRVFFLNGKIVGDFVRLPQPGSYVSNTVRGGKGILRKMTAPQKAVLLRLGKFLKKAGIAFAGADLIGKRISEVNITSPTGIPSYFKLSGIDLMPKIVDYAEREAQ